MAVRVAHSPAVRTGQPFRLRITPDMLVFAAFTRRGRLFPFLGRALGCRHGAPVRMKVFQASCGDSAAPSTSPPHSTVPPSMIQIQWFIQLNSADWHLWAGGFGRSDVGVVSDRRWSTAGGDSGQYTTSSARQTAVDNRMRL